MNQDQILSSIQECIRSQPRVAVCGGGSKTALRPSDAGAAVLDITHLQGIIDYQPEEFTMTAWAGSRVVDIERALAEQNQFLPFDPVLVERGATLGGTVASGLCGPGRYRFGGVRDFLLGVKFVDGLGNLVRSGGRVVKNAAGFDLSKFLVGSLGRYGVLAELTFKVFPRPAAYTTLQAEYQSLESAVEAVVQLNATSFELYALELCLDGDTCTLFARLGGPSEILPARLDRLVDFLNRTGVNFEAVRVVVGAPELEIWRSAREFTWVDSQQALVKVPVTPGRVASLDAAMTGGVTSRRYSAGAQVAWVAWRGALEALDGILQSQGLSGMAVLGEAAQPLIGIRTGEAFASRVKRALDPVGKFPPDQPAG
jgi:glycolate oxidase FAD binding subunit